jgi:meso-butanediol dehydrogenase/(S,S)-butanediol dehydrogenase/diacetyl reductase
MLMQAAMPLIRACTGNIVDVSSVAGQVPQPYTTACSAASGGLTMLTRTLVLELSPDGNRVNAICPGTVDTPIVSAVAEKLTDDLDTRVADRLMMMLSGGHLPGGDRCRHPLPRLARRALRDRCRARGRRRHGLT